MLIEIWERLRGYGHWTEAQAVIESANVEKTPIPGSDGATVRYTSESADTLAWFDRTGQKHSAAFTVPEDSPLFKLTHGDSVAIRFNPASPDNFYLRDLLRARVQAAFVKVIAWVAVVLVVVVFIILPAVARTWLRHHTKRLW
jgi:hypothetical protein